MNLQHDNDANRSTIDSGEPQSMSLLGGIGRGDGMDVDTDFESVESNRRQLLGQSTLLVAVVVLIAAGSLYAMRLTQGEVTSTQDDRQIDAKFEQFLIKLANPNALEANSPLAEQNLAALFEDTDPIIAMLSSDFREQQVPAEFVKKNPFVLPQKSTEAVAVGAPDTSAADARLRQLETEVQRMQLKTVMGGRTPLAMIGEEMVRVGGQLGNFTVTAIDSQALTVTLTSGEQTYTLTMQH